MSIISINSSPLPTPSKYRVLRADIDSENTGRNEAGTLFRSRLRAGVYKLEIVWRVKMTELIELTTALAPAKLSVAFFDPTTGETVTRDMYAGDASGESLTPVDENNLDDSFWEFTRNLVEY